jgi:hypothetical protein
MPAHHTARSAPATSVTTIIRYRGEPYPSRAVATRDHPRFQVVDHVRASVGRDVPADKDRYGLGNNVGSGCCQARGTADVDKTIMLPIPLAIL